MGTVAHSLLTPRDAAPLVQHAWWGYVLWIPAAAALGFGIAVVGASLLHLPRSLYLVPYVVLVSIFLSAYARWSGLALAELLRRNWLWGLAGAVVIGVFVVRNVATQPASAPGAGLPLALDLLWSGVVYGLVDALLLSVLPVLATRQAFASLGWLEHWPGIIAFVVVAWLASVLVTVSYHLGYPEYRVAGGVVGPTIGNGVMTAGYLLTTNPLAAILSHIAMHIAGVLHGPATVIQLPPHY